MKKSILKSLIISMLGLTLTSCINIKNPLTGVHMTPTRQLNQQNMSFPQAPEKIALLVPLSGSLASSGKAVRNGFLAAYYYAKQYNHHNADIIVLDTASDNINALYQQAVAQGAQVVVGPLTKRNVAVLARRYKLPVTTLALNRVGYTDKRNFYQFGLSPQDEATQIADRATDRGFKKAIVIAPKNYWGQSLANTFIKRFEENGGTTVDTLAYTSQDNLNDTIKNLLKVDKSENRGQALQSILHEEIRASSKRRQDVDVIFLAARPNTAREIKPLLKYYYAGDIPAYATSTIYSGTPHPKQDIDLDGIFFFESAWVLGNNLPSNIETIRSHSAKLWPKSFKRYKKLYALGVDAYLLATYGERVALRGATGTLFADDRNIIHRRLRLVQMHHGIPR